MADLDPGQTAKSKRLSGYSAPALEKGIAVVELLASSPEGLTISEIASALGLSISQIFRMIMVMERRQWLERDPASDRYRVTYKVLDLAYRATPAQELAQVAAPIMYNLSREAEQSCHLVARYGRNGLVIVRQEGPGPMGFAVRPGTAVDLLTSSSGHVLLAFSDSDAADDVLSAASRSEMVRLKGRLAQIRKRGCEVIDSPRVKGVRDVSYPVFGFDRRIAAALTIPYVTFIDGSHRVGFEDTREMLGEAAMNISRGLGYSP